MAIVDQYEHVNFEEELAHEKEANEGEAAEYRRILEIARRSQQTRVSERVHAIINEKNDPVDEEQENVQAITNYIVGESSAWCGGGDEVKEFRSLVTESFDTEWRDFSSKYAGVTVGQAMQKLPPIYTALSLPAPQFDALVRANSSATRPGVGAVRARVHYHDNYGNLCSMVRELTFMQTAASAIVETVKRIHTVLNIEGVDPSEYMFKVVGRAEYIYGSECIINFRYIRDSIVKLNEVSLYVMRLPFESAVLNRPRFHPQYNTAQRSNPTHELIKAANIALAPPSAAPQKYLSQWDLREKLSVRVDELSNLALSAERCKAENLRDGDDVFVCIVAEVLFGTDNVCAPMRTPWRCCKAMGSGSGAHHRVMWGPSGRLTFDVDVCDLPREVKLCLSIVAVAGDRVLRVQDFTATQLLDDSIKGQEEKLLSFVNMMNPLSFFNKDKEGESEEKCELFYMGTVSIQLFDHTAVLRSGAINVRMWTGETKANPIGTNSSNPDPAAIGCRMFFSQYALPVIQPSGAPPLAKSREMEVAHHDRMLQMDMQFRDNKIAQLRQIKRVLATDPLYDLTPTDKVLLWQYRHDLTKRPKALCKFLLAVDWMRPAAVHEAHVLLQRWAPLSSLDALEMLDARYADTKVRQYAIDRIDKMKDNELKGIVLQLVQVLKYEPYHYSALARLLIKKSVNSPHVIGHAVFWHLKAEMYNPAVSERHGLLIEEILKRLPTRRDILRQHHVVNLLLTTALRIKESKKQERLSDLRESLHKIQFPSTFTLALNPTMECTGLIITKCKVMDSKKLPLWLVFKNADPLGGSIYVIFKAGDDLRQDLLTLQMLELMDSTWKSSGLDLHLIPYGCVATGEGVGMIEVVLNSDTVANITRRDGGAQAAFSEEPLMNWLRKYNRTPSEVERCLWNFVYSTAGYCVATYILGIGDRHNDNIMVREDGTMFHIDFGHFLGNFKTKFGFKRETAPFIFTPMYAYMMGGSGSPIYAHFCDIACQAYNVIRRYSNMLIILFTLMLSTGIPELQRKEDITWLKTVLLVNASDEEAATHYRTQIEEALNNKRTLINDYIHIIAH